MNPKSNNQESSSTRQHTISLPAEAVAQIIDIAVTTALWALLRFLCVVSILPLILYIAYRLVCRAFF